MGFAEIKRQIGDGLKKHSPEILTGLGITGMITSTVLAVRATPKALLLIEEKKEEEEKDELTPLELIRTVWPCYIPSVVSSSLSIACILGANSVNNRRNAALATAYSLSESALKTYQQKVVETIGEKKEKDVRDAIAVDKLNNEHVTKERIVFVGGETLCYDQMSNEFFMCSKDKLDCIEAELNRELNHNMYASVNEFYEKVGLPYTSKGDIYGWNVYRNPVKFEPVYGFADNGSHCLIIGYEPGHEPDTHYKEYKR